MPFRKRKYLGKTKYLGKKLVCGSIGLKEPVGWTGRKMVQNLSELREQLCSNGRHLKTHPASPNLEHKHMCLGNSHIHSPLSLQLPSCCSCTWLGAQQPQLCDLGTSALRDHPRLSQGPDQPSPCWAPSPRQGCPGTKRGRQPPHRCLADQSPASVERFIRLILISLGSGSSQNRHPTNSADNLPLLLSIKLSVCNLQHGY